MYRCALTAGRRERGIRTGKRKGKGGESGTPGPERGRARAEEERERGERGARGVEGKIITNEYASPDAGFHPPQL
jgi:hypothetical protein